MLYIIALVEARPLYVICSSTGGGYITVWYTIVALVEVTRHCTTYIHDLIIHFAYSELRCCWVPRAHDQDWMG